MSKKKRGRPKRGGNSVGPTSSHENKLTDAQIEERRTTQRNAVITVMGDDSGQSRQNAWYLEWAFESLLFAFSKAKAALTEEAIRDILPAEVLRLAFHVNWIPYLDEDGEPYPEMVGDVEVHGYGVTQDFYDAFLRLLPIEDFIEHYKMPWVKPTPEDIIHEVLEEIPWKKLQLIEQMQIVNGTQYVPKPVLIDGKRTNETILVIPQDAKERHQLNNLLTVPSPGARRNTAQEDTRKTLVQVIRKYSIKYATITEEQLLWRRP